MHMCIYIQMYICICNIYIYIYILYTYVIHMNITYIQPYSATQCIEYMHIYMAYIICMHIICYIYYTMLTIHKCI